MESADFIDYYEILEISPNANSGTVERMFRYLAQRYHPDNRETGDRFRFDVLVEAHNTLKDSVLRAQYDVQHKARSGFRSQLAAEARDGGGVDRDAEIQSKLLSLLYVKRRRSVGDPGVSDFELERLAECPPEYLEFHLWYLKEKGWIKRTENGTIAITVEGVDRANAEHRRDAGNHLLTDQSRAE